MGKINLKSTRHYLSSSLEASETLTLRWKRELGFFVDLLRLLYERLKLDMDPLSGDIEPGP